MKKNKLGIVLPFVLLMLLLLTAFTACGNSGNEGNDGDDLAPRTTRDVVRTDVQDIGEGSTTFTFEVTDENGEVTSWNVHTDEGTVGAALLAVELISGNESSFGLMVTEVNGVTADFNADGAYWAFYIDGEMASAGVDATNIEQGQVYSFVYTKD